MWEVLIGRGLFSFKNLGAERQCSGKLKTLAADEEQGKIEITEGNVGQAAASGKNHQRIRVHNEFRRPTKSLYSSGLQEMIEARYGLGGELDLFGKAAHRVSAAYFVRRGCWGGGGRKRHSWVKT